MIIPVSEVINLYRTVGGACHFTYVVLKLQLAIIAR